MTEAELLILLFYLLLGGIAGIIGGLLGLGGGIIIVPVLLVLFIQQEFISDILMHLAVATSLTTIVFTSMSSAFAHHRRGAVLWRPVALFVPGIILGGILGAVIADHLPSDTLRIIFGIFEILVGLQIGFGVKFNKEVFSQQGYLCGSDQRRAKEIGRLFADKKVKAMMAVRGGFGTSRLVEFLDKKK